MNAPSTLELMLRMVVSLAIMGGLLWGVLKVAKGRRGRSLLGAMGGPKVEHIDVRARRQLSRSASLSLVRVGSRTLLLGVGEKGVQLLAEGDDLVAGDAPTAAPDQGRTGQPIDPERVGTPAPGAGGPNPARIGVVDALRELTVRR